MAVRGVYL
jgi:hypothetical protein